ncbi:hypothetical protein [Parasphingopyxis lamellibrachiae]|uniref:Uncharacterized protein n=1 Tax=Parasphingopyxis lamellibrachiae TaxID=680125 RepID=A0A3D9FG22_9SPHN|nr:hypothetical protein [Parasphingopyxis lamellibrachiae]RED16770.1 hypothetical protein DFR46_1800 [Parasphingopyxis lamellibrachiae]
MTNQAQAIAALVETARGNRPQSLENREVEETLNIALALLVELSVANDKIDRLERLVAKLRGEDVEALREIRYDGAVADQRQETTDALLMRVLRILIDPRAQAES